MSNLEFSNSEIRLATATLAAVAVILPAIYIFRGDNDSKSSPQMATFNKYIRAYSSLRPAAITANASSSFTHTVLPSSLNLPSRSLEPFQQHSTMIFSLFSDFKMIPQANGEGNAVHYCKETNTVVAHCRMGGKINAESEKGRTLIESGLQEWWTECVLSVRLSDDGRRVVEVREFVDSAKAGELQRRLSGVLSD